MRLYSLVWKFCNSLKKLWLASKYSHHVKPRFVYISYIQFAIVCNDEQHKGIQGTLLISVNKWRVCNGNCFMLLATLEAGRWEQQWRRIGRRMGWADTTGQSRLVEWRVRSRWRSSFFAKRRRHNQRACEGRKRRRHYDDGSASSQETKE